MSTTESASPVCHNCGTVLHGPFCAACGQESKPLNPRLRAVVRDAVQEFFDVDGRTFRSVRRLFLSPGFLTREQFGGRRVSWVTPFRLYLVFSVAYFALASVTDTKVVTINRGRGTVSASASTSGVVEAPTQEDIEATNRSVQQLGYKDVGELERAVRGSMFAWMPRVMFVLVPFFAALVALIRIKSRLTYPQHVWFALHVHAVWFGLGALTMAVRYLQFPTVAGVLETLGTFYGVIYLVLAMHAAYGIRKRRAVLDSVILLVVYGIVAGAALLAIVLPTIFWHR